MNIDLKSPLTTTLAQLKLNLSRQTSMRSARAPLGPNCSFSYAVRVIQFCCSFASKNETSSILQLIASDSSKEAMPESKLWPCLFSCRYGSHALKLCAFALTPYTRETEFGYNFNQVPPSSSSPSNRRSSFQMKRDLKDF